MGWWPLALMLVLVPWHTRNPGLWLWVLMSCLPEINPCLLCFGPPLQRSRLCYYMTGAFVNEPTHKKCLQALVEAAKPLASVTVGSGQREELREIVMDALYSLEEQRGKIPACIPPCGFQAAARVFQCATCRFVDCQLPLDCPVQDLWTYTDETIVLRCKVPFHVPPGVPITWMYAPNLRTQDMTLFKQLKGNPEKPFSLTIEEPAAGTVACFLGEQSKPIIRKFFYLNVSEGSVEEEKGLQAVFTSVLQWDDETPTHIPTMGLALGFGSMAFVLLLIASWQCLCVRQKCRRRGHQGTQEDSRSLDSLSGTVAHGSTRED
ncbi:sperm acrosome membrane-associated protein 6 isoform X2 [Passer domesticus]|uniref:sperm acrosome membrane-associated protein 6 isoform X2 n=1 Tax=Passer domesticus TaxID=48849 RepID=UPI0030FE569B